MSKSSVESQAQTESKNASNEPQEGYYKHFHRQSSIHTTLAVLNTATEILRTYRKPIEITDVVSLASQLEQWALRN